MTSDAREQNEKNNFVLKKCIIFKNGARERKGHYGSFKKNR